MPTDIDSMIHDRAALPAVQPVTRRPDVTAIVVQPLIRAGVEMIVGSIRDEQFGHVVMCGSGGTLVELLRDTTCRLAPLTAEDVTEMLDDVRGTALLRGYRGAPRRDESALRTILLRVSALVESCPDIVELDFNPVLVTTAGACIVDARVRVGPRLNTARSR